MFFLHFPVRHFAGMLSVLRFLIVAARAVSTPEGPRIQIEESSLQWLFPLATDVHRPFGPKKQGWRDCRIIGVAHSD